MRAITIKQLKGCEKKLNQMSLQEKIVELQYSEFGCRNCLQYCCECNNREKANVYIYKDVNGISHLSCKSYIYYD
jgi:hypothetical protein